MQLALTAQKIYYYSEPVDFRKSIDGLVALVMLDLDVKPSDGVFVFYNRAKDKLKILAWHGNGFILLYKRLEKGNFTPVRASQSEQSVSLSNDQLSWLLAGLNWDQMSNWNTLNYDNYC